MASPIRYTSGRGPKKTQCCISGRGRVPVLMWRARRSCGGTMPQLRCSGQGMPPTCASASQGAFPNCSRASGPAHTRPQEGPSQGQRSEQPWTRLGGETRWVMVNGWPPLGPAAWPRRLASKARVPGGAPDPLDPLPCWDPAPAVLQDGSAHPLREAAVVEALCWLDPWLSCVRAFL